VKALYSPRVTSLLAGALPGAEVCPDLILLYVFDVPKHCYSLVACWNVGMLKYIMCPVDCRQNLSETDPALETFRNVWLELNNCHMDSDQHSVLK
jgi:hypothetical protein